MPCADVDAAVLKPSTCSISTGYRAKAARGVWGPRGMCFATVLKPSKCSISTWNAEAFDLSKRWQGAKAARKGFGAMVERASQRLRNPLNAVFRFGKAEAFDLAKRWQGAKAARKGLGPWWNVLRSGFETF